MKDKEMEDIIYRYFRGQLADGEYSLMTDFLQDEENKAYFDQVKKEWELQPELDEQGQKNLARLLCQLNYDESIKSKVTANRKLLIQIATLAAILVSGLLIGSALTWFVSQDYHKSEQIVFQTPRGEKSMVILPDGSEVWLNANSRLIYNSFTSSRRNVELKGEAFFKVKRNVNAPFVVKTNECDIRVLGTTFNVMAYDEFGRKEITLLSGKVDVLMQGNNQELNPGEALVLKNHQFAVKESDPIESSAWIENKFNFHNIPLTELMKRLENWYDVDITLVNYENRVVSFTGTFKNEETIWQVLDAIKIYTPIRYDKTDLRKITITVGK
jgi:transmembrane sensor